MDDIVVDVDVCIDNDGDDDDDAPTDNDGRIRGPGLDCGVGGRYHHRRHGGDHH